MDRHTEIQKLLQKEEGQLLSQLYTEITGKKFHIISAKGRGIYTHLRQLLLSVLWLADHFEALYQCLCVKWEYCTKRVDPKYSDKVTLTSAIADVISVASLGIPPFTISVLLVKLGLDKFCACENKIPAHDFIDAFVSKWIAKASGKAPGHENYFDADFYRAWAQLGLKYFSDGRIEEAKKKFKTAFLYGGKKAQKDAWMWNEYGWALVKAGHYDEAIKAARQACNLMQKSWYLDTLGWALFKNGDYEKSISPLRKAVESDRKKDLEVQYHLVCAYIMTRNKRLADELTKRMYNIDGTSSWTLAAQRAVESECVE